MLGFAQINQAKIYLLKENISFKENNLKISEFNSKIFYKFKIYKLNKKVKESQIFFENKFKTSL